MRLAAQYCRRGKCDHGHFESHQFLAPETVGRFAATATSKGEVRAEPD
jgi:hypothetical protein